MEIHGVVSLRKGAKREQIHASDPTKAWLFY